METDTELTGTVVRVVYTHPETHWTVLSLQVDPPDDGGPAPVGPVTVVGTMAGIREQERLAVTGHYEVDPRRGRRFRMERYRIALPVTRDGIQRYLSSGLIPGIGPKSAELLVKRFGEHTLDIIRRSPERLRTVKGIGQKKVAEIARAFREHSGHAELLAWLQGIGVSLNLARKLYALWGDAAVGKLRANPWLLADELSGVGFTRADAIAAGLGLGGDHPERVAAGLLHALDEARREGHVAMPEAALRSRTAELLAASPEVVDRALAAQLAAGRVVREPQGEDALVYAAELHRAEVRAARRLVRLLRSPPGAELLAPLAIAEIEAHLGLSLAPEQREAVVLALKAPVVVVTGGPGTGKTTIVRAIVSAFRAVGHTVALAAPTGRAAKRLATATGPGLPGASQGAVLEARTIHRLLEWSPAKGGFARDEDQPIDAHVVIVDEVSMVDLQLFDALLRALRPSTRLVLVGDADQLPSVGPGAVLRDLIASGVVPVAALTRIFRQGRGSLIAENAHRVLAGQLPEDAPTGEGGLADFYWIRKESPPDLLAVLERLLTQRIPGAFGLDPRRDVQVLTPQHRGPLGAEALNRALRAWLNPGGATDAPDAPRFSVGDKVMQVRNNYDKEAYNGDVGFVTEALDGLVRVHFEESGREVTYSGGEASDLQPAWAISIHKSQGSEYPAVVLVLHTGHHVMLRRNLVYTALTRGRRLVVLLGPVRAVERALSEGTTAPRHGALATRLRAELASGTPQAGTA